MAARLTDRQKKKIAADYLECGSYRATAKMNGVSADSVKRVVDSTDGFEQMAAQKREENTADMIAYMESRKGQAQNIIDLYLQALANPDKLDGASLAQIATALGIVVDKFTKNTAGGDDSLNKLDGLLREFKDAVKQETD